MNDQLIKLVKQELGEGPTVEQIIEHLFDSSALTSITVRRYVIGTKFFNEYSTGSRTAHDIEQDLAVEFNLKDHTVNKIRRRYIQGGK